MERIEIEAQNNLCVARQYAYILETFNVSKGRVPITKKKSISTKHSCCLSIYARLYKKQKTCYCHTGPCQISIKG